jgi:adhesin HecA-like repeat protein
MSLILPAEMLLKCETSIPNSIGAALAFDLTSPVMNTVNNQGGQLAAGGNLNITVDTLNNTRNDTQNDTQDTTKTQEKNQLFLIHEIKKKLIKSAKARVTVTIPYCHGKVPHSRKLRIIL